MDLNKIIKKSTSDLTARVEFRDGIILHLRYVSRAKLRDISQQSEVRRYNPKYNARLPEADPKKFVELFCRAAVTGWEGVTPRSISNIVAVDETTLTPEQMDSDIPFTHEALITLAQEAYQLDNFIQEASMDIATFKPGLEDELKNSSPSQSGNSQE